MKKDARLEAFCSPEVLDCFKSVVHENEVWKRDPFDVESIHGHAREKFDFLLHQLRNEREGTGKIWLLKGESGAGKTHLMRFFRNHLHDEGYGYFAYMQMISVEKNYFRYILKHTLDSLDKPYIDDPTGSITGLMRLSRALAEDQRAVSPNALEKLRDADLSPDAVIGFVHKLANNFFGLQDYNDVHEGLIRSLLFLQRDDNQLKRRVMSYLRCENMSTLDQQWLGAVPLTEDDAPKALLQSLARLIWKLDAGVLVICLDQLEYLYQDDADSAKRFRDAVQAVNGLISECPRLLVLISCLEDYYLPLRQRLTQSDIDRLEYDPDPVNLNAYFDHDAIEALIGRRLEVLYDLSDVDFDENTPLYPFPAGLVDALAGQRIRDVLNRCRELRDQSMRTGQAPELDLAPPPLEPGKTPDKGGINDEALQFDWEQRWNDFLTQSTLAPPEDDAEMQQILTRVIAHCSDEVAPHHGFKVWPVKGGIAVDTLSGDRFVENLLVSLCNKSARGGALGKQLRDAESAAESRKLVVVRSTAFPGSPRTRIAQQIAELLSRGARRVVIEDSDWRAMMAMLVFREENQNRPGFADWLVSSQPIGLRPALKVMLGLEHLMASKPPEPKPPEPQRTDKPKPQRPIIAQPRDLSALQLGQSRDYKPQPVTLKANDLTRHAAFLGGSGSGKTTLALNIVEQLLQRGIPALFVDRKGDLANYARVFRAVGQADSVPNKQVKSLMDGLDVALYTPGNAQGRPLGIPIIPGDIGQLPSNEREQIANSAALALGGMMNYKPQGQARTRLAILAKAIAVLAELRPDARIGLDDLIEFIAGENSELIYAIGQLETRHFRKLVEDLETLRLMNGALFTDQGESLDCEALLGLGKHRLPGRTRLSIISTAFLGDTSNVLFWVSRLLLEIGRHARRQPTDRLQCVIMLDEADLYLPATSKPATKEPLENLLRRARSAGIGLLLATQSPGDFDYKSRDQINNWFLGQIKESTALNKLKPMLSEAQINVETKLPGQEPGQFFVIREGRVTSLKARLSLIRAEQVPEDEILDLARG